MGVWWLLKGEEGQQVRMEEEEVAGLRSADLWTAGRTAVPLSRTWKSKDFPSHAKWVRLFREIHRSHGLSVHTRAGARDKSLLLSPRGGWESLAERMAIEVVAKPDVWCFLGVGSLGHRLTAGQVGRLCRLGLSVWNSAMHSGKVDRTGEHVACGESLGIDMWCGWKGWRTDVDVSP